MRLLARIGLMVSGVLALGCLFIFVDLTVVHISSANASMLDSMALSFGLFAGLTYLALRSLKMIRRPSASQPQSAS